jgi:hypothetical protein
MYGRKKRTYQILGGIHHPGFLAIVSMCKMLFDMHHVGGKGTGSLRCSGSTIICIIARGHVLTADASTIATALDIGMITLAIFF